MRLGGCRKNDSSDLFANEAKSHEPLVGKYIDIDLPEGPSETPPTMHVRFTLGPQ